MISGAFHISSQEWRYFAREKSIVHTAHLAQLPPTGTHAGDTVLIQKTAPIQSQIKGNNYPIQTPSAPYFQSNFINVTNSSFVIDCYGCVNFDGQILAQSKMDISIGAMEGAQAQITMTPETSGFFVVHVEASSDFRTFGYQGVSDDGQLTAQILVGNAVVSQSQWRMRMEGTTWDAVHMYLNSIGRVNTECLVSAGSFTGMGLGLGSKANGARFAMWAYKVADYG